MLFWCQKWTSKCKNNDCYKTISVNSIHDFISTIRCKKSSHTKHLKQKREWQEGKITHETPTERFYQKKIFRWVVYNTDNVMVGLKHVIFYPLFWVI